MQETRTVILLFLPNNDRFLQETRNLLDLLRKSDTTD